MKIIVPIDFSENSIKALDFAFTLAEKKDGEIILVHVIEIVYDFASQAAIALDSMYKDSEGAFKKLISTYKSSKVKISYKLIEGTASITTANLAEEEQADLIVMGTQGISGLKKTLMGSTAVNTIREASCPVLVVPNQAKVSGIKKITLALEFADHEEKFIDWIIGLSQRWELGLEFLHVQTETSFKDKLCLKGLESFLEEKHPGLPVKIHTFFASSAFEGLNAYLDEAEETILVMCHEHKNLWNQVLHKSQSIEMAYHTHIPLLIMN
ncbi:nucleotide-binding universal stress UspA family protein [Algoriphagus boseongensis]|uniref:Nucleotide-binding universal stress UspA family protein n=1 Tax=Algoriphagus boseongensis TaxID=1442587 RepID=A0A4R6TCA5_9BACT|nr:universal stress protein [Algoriphagus boseongensis]TDQ19335.1 nucleotide-binding universal stress UspA family protein [Algoriphagus boseongensis]